MANATPESKPLNKLAILALRELNKTHAATVQEILEAAADADGIDPKAGWRFDMQTVAWVKQPAE